MRRKGPFDQVLSFVRRFRAVVRRLLVATLVLTAIFYPSRTALEQTLSYTVSEILGGIVACAINNLGDIAGRGANPGSGEMRAMIWSHGDRIPEDLGKLDGGDHSAASGLNDIGEVAGAANISSAIVPILWIRGSGFRRTPLLPGDNCGQAKAINRHGHVTGYSSGASGKRAFLWRRGINVRALDPLSGGSFSRASGVNDADDVVGTSGSACGDRAVVWTGGGEVIDLDMLPGDTSSEATAINNNGVVIGWSKGPQGMRAFVWTRNNGMKQLPTLAGGISSRALSINDADVVVGSSTSASGDRAVVWLTTTEIRDLNRQASIPSGVVLVEARAINNRGQILALGMNMHESENGGHASTCAAAPSSSYLLTPQ